MHAHYAYAQLGSSVSSHLGQHTSCLLVDQQHMNMCISLNDLFLIYVADSYYQVCRVVPQIGNGYIDDDGGPGG